MHGWQGRDEGPRDGRKETVMTGEGKERGEQKRDTRKMEGAYRYKEEQYLSGSVSRLMDGLICITCKWPTSAGCCSMIGPCLLCSESFCLTATAVV